MRNLDPRSDQEFTQQLVHIRSRLNRAINAMADGDESGADDAAHMMRMLLTRGKGDDALRRALKRWHLEEPRLSVSSPPKTAPFPLFGFGNIPTKFEPEYRRYLSDWLATRCLALAGMQPSTYSWEDFITTYANTNGSHLAGSVPQVLNQIKMTGIASIGLGTFIIWAGASGSLLALDEVLVHREILAPNSPIFPPTPIAMGEVFVQPNGDLTVLLGPMDNGNTNPTNVGADGFMDAMSVTIDSETLQRGGWQQGKSFHRALGS